MNTFKLKEITSSGTNLYAGTVEAFVKNYKFTLKRGHFWDRKVKVNPKTPEELIDSLNLAAKALSWSNTHFELA